MVNRIDKKGTMDKGSLTGHALFDLHAHTNKYSPCGQMTPVEYINAAKEKGLFGICLTEHNTFWPEDEYKKLCDRAEGLVVINGNEQRCWDSDVIQGDFLIFGCRFNIENPNIYELTEIVHNLGGVIIAAHPFREMLGVKEDLIYKLDIDAIEVYSSNQEPLQTQLAFSVANRMDLPLVSGSDAHIKELVGYAVTEFTTTIKNEKDFVNAIKNRQVIPVPRREQNGINR